LPDVLSCDGRNLFLRDKRLDLTGAEQAPEVPHLYSSAGLLDPDWWHRTYWIFGTKVYGRASGWSVVGNYVPSGRLLVLDDTCVYGYGRKRIAGGDRGLSDVPFHLFRADQRVAPLHQKRPIKNNNLAIVRHFEPTKVTYHWSREVPVVVRALVLADGLLFAAGPSMALGRDAVEPTFDDAGRTALDPAVGASRARWQRHCESRRAGSIGPIGPIGPILVAAKGCASRITVACGGSIATARSFCYYGS
jgi:hypothetical protein